MTGDDTMPRKVTLSSRSVSSGIHPFWMSRDQKIRDKKIALVAMIKTKIADKKVISPEDAERLVDAISDSLDFEAAVMQKRAG